MKMRPFQIISLAIFGILAVGGLYFFSTYKGISGSNSIGAITLWGTLPAGSMQATLEDLKRTHQEYSKVVYVERSAETFETDLSDALASGGGPDLVLISQEQLLANRNKLQIIPYSSIPERTFRDSYVSMFELFLTQTGTYGIPFAVDPLVLYYNRSVLSTAGYSQPPATWEQLLGMAPTLTQKTASTIKKSAIALGTYENISNARAIVSLLLLQSGTPITQPSTSGFASALTKGGATTAGVSPATSAITFYTQFADPAKVVYSWNRSLPGAQEVFLAGDSAFYIGFASEYSFLKGANPNLDFDMTAIPAPQTATEHVDYAHAYVFALPRAVKNVTGAYQVASALASPTQSTIFSQSAGMSPALRSLVSARTNDVNAAVYNPLTLISKGWLSPAPSVTDTIFADMINTVVSGRGTVSDALRSADSAIGAALNR